MDLPCRQPLTLALLPLTIDQVSIQFATLLYSVYDIYFHMPIQVTLLTGGAL